MTNENDIEWPEVFDVPDYSLLVANELVPAIGLPPPDGKISLQQDVVNIDAIFDNINDKKDTTNETDTDN